MSLLTWLGFGAADAETRSRSLENPSVSLASPEAWSIGWGGGRSEAGVDVTVATALGVPAFWSGTNFIAGTVAGLPLETYSLKADGQRELDRSSPLARLLEGPVNDDGLTRFDWLHAAMITTLTRGRSVTFVERSAAGRVLNLWPLDADPIEVVRRDQRTLYIRRPRGGRVVEYGASEVIDLAWMRMPDGISVADPVASLRNALGLSIALENYASRFFQNGGVPPLALKGPAASPAAAARGASDVAEAVRKSHETGDNVIYLPSGHELVPVGFNPEQGQLLEARLFQVQEIARILNLPPAFLHDLSRATFSNVEQQDINFVKHSLTQWVERLEQQLNAKLFGPKTYQRRVEFDIDGLLRGDFKSRSEALAAQVQNGLLTPNEARQSENRPALPGGDSLLIQGATVPLTAQTDQPPVTPASAEPAPNA